MQYYDNKSYTSAFTLLELMMIVGIIAILTIIAIPRYQSHLIKSHLLSVMQEIRHIHTHFEICFLQGQFTLDPTKDNYCDLKIEDQLEDQLIETGVDFNNPETLAWISVQFGNNTHYLLHNNNAGIQWTRNLLGKWECYFGKINQNTATFTAMSPLQTELIRYTPKGCIAVI